MCNWNYKIYKGTSFKAFAMPIKYYLGKDNEKIWFVGVAFENV